MFLVDSNFNSSQHACTFIFLYFKESAPEEKQPENPGAKALQNTERLSAVIGNTLRNSNESANFTVNRPNIGQYNIIPVDTLLNLCPVQLLML